MATKKPKLNVDPGRPVNRPLAKEVAKDPNWGKTLTPKELSALLKKLEAKQEEEKMSKLSDTLAKALAKKKGLHHIENDGTPAKETKKKVKTAPPTGKKPPTRSAGRGR